MKKLTLLAAMAAAVLSANAQYSTTDAGIQPVLDKGAETFWLFQCDPGTVETLKKAGKTVHEYFLGAEAGRQLDVWAGGETLKGGDSTMPGVDFHADGYVSFEVVAPAGWSGGGFQQLATPAPMDLKGINENTRLHLAYMAPNNPVKQLGLTLLDNFADGKKDKAAKFCIGATFDALPSVAPLPTDEWQAVDISFGDLKKLCPAFDWTVDEEFTGYYLSFTCGATPGQLICFDAFYFYQPKGESGISSIEMGNSDIVITGKTVNASGANRIEIFDLAGKSVKAANASVLGLNDIPAGLYIVKADNAVAKVVVK